ncbi:MAG: hemerythrin domain-containing protein [bacterium]
MKTRKAQPKSKRVAKTAAKSVVRAARTVTSAARKATLRKSAPRRAAKRKTEPVHDAIALLKIDHKRLRTLLETLQAAQTLERRTKLIGDTERALKQHTQLEEQLFYPAFRDAAKTKRDRQMFYEATEEHHTVDVVLPEVKEASYEPDVFAARAKVLKELVEHHIEEEQDELFPRARQLLPAAELREIGVQMAERQRAAAKPVGALQAVGELIGLGRRQE